MNFTKVYRHGDVILYKLDENLPATDANHNVISMVLAEGEVTGHSHKLVGDFEVLESKPLSGDLKFKVKTTAVLTHEEHDKIVLEKGIYLKVNQVEYNPFTDLVKKVVD
jgi:hypothetical protein